MDKRLTEKRGLTCWNVGKETIVARGEVSDGDGIVFNSAGDDHFYHIGPAIERLYEYEELGYTPKELRSLIRLVEPKPLNINAIRDLGNMPTFYRDIHAIIDTGMKKRDRSVSIYFGKDGISVDVIPYPEVLDIKKEKSDE